MPVDRRLMTPDEIALARAFADVSFPPATMHKRMARDFTNRVWEEMAGHPIFGMISEGEARVMRNIAWRFRRQLPAALRPSEKPPLHEIAPKPCVPDQSARKGDGRDEPRLI